MIPELLSFLKKCLLLVWTGCKNVLVDVYNLFIFLTVRGKSNRKCKYKSRHKYNW